VRDRGNINREYKRSPQLPTTTRKSKKKEGKEAGKGGSNEVNPYLLACQGGYIGGGRKEYPQFNLNPIKKLTKLG